jgi:hypothetical protein
MIELVAGFYGRQSDDESEVTRDNQIKWCRKFIPTVESWISQERRQPVRITLNNNLVFFDRDKSGIVNQRPEYDRCKNAVAAGQMHLLLIHAQDRLTRSDPFETVFELRYFRYYDVRVYSQSDNHELTSDDSVEFLRTTLDSIKANDEWKRIRKRTLEGRFTAWEKDNARMSFGRRPRLGYHLDEDKHVAVVPEEAEIINTIFDWTIEGLTYFEVAHKLNREGIPTVTALRSANPGARWSPSAVSRVINCEEYATGQTTMTVNDGSDTRHEVIITVPVIVDAERFYAAQRIVDKRRRTRKRSVPYLLKGALICADCGNGIICTTGHYGCRGRVHARRWDAEPCRLPYIPPKKLDPVIWQDVQTFVSRPDIIYDALESQSIQQMRELNDRLVNVESAIERKRQARGRLALQFALEEFTADEIKIARMHIDGEIAQLEKEHMELQLNRAILQRYDQQIDRFEQLSEIDLNRLPHDGKVALIMELVHHIDISRIETGIRAVAHYHLLDSGSITSHQTPDMLTYRTEPLLIEL